MTMMFCRNRVLDFARWKTIFDSHAPAHRAAGLHLKGLWREVEQPNNVFFLFEVTDTNAAQGFISNVDAVKAAEISGVLDGEYHFLENYPTY